MQDYLRLSNRRILVTGASSGIGRATAIALSRQDAQVILVGRDEDRLEETLGLMNEGAHISIAADLTEFTQYEEIFDRASEGGKISGLVHCAGVVEVIPAKVVTYQKMLDMFDINFFAFMELVKYFTKKRFSNGGSIVAVSALSAHQGRKAMSVYSASKGALEAAVRSLSFELIDRGFRVNAVVPGPVSTPMAVNSQQNFGFQIEEQASLGIAKPENIADTILYLLSDVSEFVTGRNCFVDGGRIG